ncbi:MAG: (2Fe-2S) ferredoxin domain-containing protein [Christensenellaceae bacterium]|nr:(2Fe-2S) ferredoxin domain-containing protein [Christensenellaceae bacterium]
MKSLEELATIRERMQSQVILREGQAETRVVVGMGTCGIAAGARPVLNTLVEEVMNNDLFKKVTVSQNGCIGMCNFEPIVEVFGKDTDRVTYVKVTPEMAKEIVQKHLIGGTPIAEYTIEAVEK